MVAATAILFGIGGLIATSALVLHLQARRRAVRSEFLKQFGLSDGFRKRSMRENNEWMPTDFFETPEGVEICEAISTDNYEQLREFVDSGFDVNVSGKAGMTPLYWAFLDEDIKAFKLLLASGADPDAELTDGIMVRGDRALFRGDSVLFTSLRKPGWEFFAAGLPYTSDASQRDGNDGTLLHACLEGPSIKYSGKSVHTIIDSGVDLDAQDEDGYTAAMLAAAWDRPLLCLCVLKAGADPDIRDNNGETVGDILSWKLKHYERHPSTSPKPDDAIRLRDWLEAHPAEPFEEDGGETGGRGQAQLLERGVRVGSERP